MYEPRVGVGGGGGYYDNDDKDKNNNNMYLRNQDSNKNRGRYRNRDDGERRVRNAMYLRGRHHGLHAVYVAVSSGITQISCDPLCELVRTSTSRTTTKTGEATGVETPGDLFHPGGLLGASSVIHFLNSLGIGCSVESEALERVVASHFPSAAVGRGVKVGGE